MLEVLKFRVQAYFLRARYWRVTFQMKLYSQMIQSEVEDQCQAELLTTAR